MNFNCKVKISNVVYRIVNKFVKVIIFLNFIVESKLNKDAQPDIDDIYKKIKIEVRNKLYRRAKNNKYDWYILDIVDCAVYTENDILDEEKISFTEVVKYN